MTTEPADTTQRYMFDAAWQTEQRRLMALETIWDANTFSHLREIDLPEEARCLEVGAGNGSVAAWICDRVGPRGQVVATDLDTRFLRARTGANLEVRAHDITADDIEEGAFDLVHTRLLLSHLPDHHEALRRMTAALKPGGWLVVEEFDHVSFLPDPGCDLASQSVWAAWTDAFEILAATRGLDLAYGRRLRGILAAAGLSEVETDGRTFLERGGVQGRDLLLLSVQSLRQNLVATGAITGAEIDRLVTMLSDPGFRWQSQIMVTARGRKPSNA